MIEGHFVYIPVTKWKCSNDKTSKRYCILPLYCTLPFRVEKFLSLKESGEKHFKSLLKSNTEPSRTAFCNWSEFGERTMTTSWRSVCSVSSRPPGNAALWQSQLLFAITNTLAQAPTATATATSPHACHIGQNSSSSVLSNKQANFVTTDWQHMAKHWTDISVGWYLTGRTAPCGACSSFGTDTVMHRFRTKWRLYTGSLF